MRITIDEVLQKHNKTRYWLSREIGCKYQNLVKLCNGETKSITFDLIERITKALDCTPNDIFDVNK
jgi:putative transcriptional regulator